MKKIMLLCLMLIGCSNPAFHTEQERLKRINEMTPNEMRNTLRVCALSNSNWSNCFNAMFLYKDELTGESK